ncbi:hypothetical protein Gotri_014256 [Gossypium trilobum]|uniref:Epidermal patterning factor-like protein n=3 Tax=Gossypium TaxID=3633 RepID=A0A7J9DWB2_9ROSI|nr:hypothetical protein ES319_D02G078400v1 [Gossypium barbadense]MBA0764991.1 hypothetical protein [Gossypium trilobum]PPD72583.1 hypothetical protein GOBAR_DD30512 [Gossypium barbadense]TYG78733.1 hypothetical protein ES288_D02G083900v1 [Gossypium darwinii]
MKNFSFGVGGLLLVSFFVLLCLSTETLLVPLHHHHANNHGKATTLGDLKLQQVNPEEGRGMELYTTGSSLPDCTHACGACFPCKRVMVSFKCSMAESCPIVYKCMCKGKYYHVPSK